MNLLQGDEEARQFQDLTEEVQDKWRQEFVIARCGFSREKAAAITPASIKALKPPLPSSASTHPQNLRPRATPGGTAIQPAGYSSTCQTPCASSRIKYAVARSWDIKQQWKI